MKKLYKSKNERKICGVCGGFAEYFGVDPLLVRLISILLIFGLGSGLLTYIVAAIMMPEADK